MSPNSLVLLVGAPGSPNGGFNAGSVYLFTRKSVFGKFQENYRFDGDCDGAYMGKEDIAINSNEMAMDVHTLGDGCNGDKLFIRSYKVGCIL